MASRTCGGLFYGSVVAFDTSWGGFEGHSKPDECWITQVATQIAVGFQRSPTVHSIMMLKRSPTVYSIMIFSVKQLYDLPLHAPSPNGEVFLSIVCWPLPANAVWICSSVRGLTSRKSWLWPLINCYGRYHWRYSSWVPTTTTLPGIWQQRGGTDKNTSWDLDLRAAEQAWSPCCIPCSPRQEVTWPRYFNAPPLMLRAVNWVGV